MIRPAVAPAGSWWAERCLPACAGSCFPNQRALAQGSLAGALCLATGVSTLSHLTSLYTPSRIPSALVLHLCLYNTHLVSVLQCFRVACAVLLALAGQLLAQPLRQWHAMSKRQLSHEGHHGESPLGTSSLWQRVPACCACWPAPTLINGLCSLEAIAQARFAPGRTKSPRP